MPQFISKTDYQKREYYRQLDIIEGENVFQQVKSDLRKKVKPEQRENVLKSFNTYFTNQMNRIAKTRNTKNKRVRNKWNTLYFQLLSGIKNDRKLQYF